MAIANNRGARSRRRKPRTEKLGSWQNMVGERMFGSGEVLHSAKDIMLRQEYKRALEGKPKAIRTMMALLEVAVEQERYRPVELGGSLLFPGEAGAEDPDNADLGLLLLGIGAIEDRALEPVGKPGDSCYESELKKVRVTRLEKWVLDIAVNKPDDPELSSWQKHALSDFAPASKQTCGRWYANKRRILTDLMKLRGPKGSRFQPGKSGNPKGRPVVWRGGVPADDFFVELIPFSIGGDVRMLTRLDALMNQLVKQAMSGDEKVARIIMPTLMRLQKKEWRLAAAGPIKTSRI
jgi:hypothetical protein